MKNKKAQLVNALGGLSSAAIQFFIFALVIIVAFKGMSGIKDTLPQVTSADNATYGNITLVESGLGQFPSNANLIATVIVLSTVILLVSSAFIGGRR